MRISEENRYRQNPRGHSLIFSCEDRKQCSATMHRSPEHCDRLFLIVRFTKI